jgi:hypothetical protein
MAAVPTKARVFPLKLPSIPARESIRILEREADTLKRLLIKFFGSQESGNKQVLGPQNHNGLSANNP